MQESEILIKLILSVVFGAILGLETETREIENKGKTTAGRESTQRLGGFRTYTLISLFGGVAGIFYLLESHVIAYLLLSSIIIMVLLAYYLNVQVKKAFGLTTEVAIIITFTLGFLTTSNLVRFEILLGILVLIAFFLSQKRGIGKFINKIQHKELIDVIKFGLVSLIALPILPNQDFYLNDVFRFLNTQQLINRNLEDLYIINPFEIWLIVVLISGINLLAYFLSRSFGTKKGILITALFGGFFSSTSTLVSFASKSRSLTSEGLIKRYAGGAVLATGVSFILAAILFAVSNVILFQIVFPLLLIMLGVGIIYGVLFIDSKDGDTSKDTENGAAYEPFSLIPAVKFVGMIIIITLFIQVLQSLRINDLLIVVATAISGVTGIDAPIIAISNLNNSGNIATVSAAIIFVFTNTINLIAKMIYSKMMGSALFFKYTTLGLLLTALVGAVALLLVL